MLRRAVPFLLIFAAAVVDLGVIGSLKNLHIFPFLTLLAVIYAVFYRNVFEAMVLAITGGFILDSFSSPFGLNMLVFFTTVCVLNIFLVHSGKPHLSPLVFTTSVTVFVLSLISIALNLELPLRTSAFLAAIPAALYAGIFALISYPAWNKIYEVLGYYDTTVKLPGKTF